MAASLRYNHEFCKDTAHRRSPTTDSFDTHSITFQILHKILFETVIKEVTGEVTICRHVPSKKCNQQSC